MRLTDKQLDCIWWKLSECERNERIVKGTGPDTEWFKENIDLGTASDVITMFNNGVWREAINQLNSLGANIKFYG